MTDTKEKILNEALLLFAQNGYEAVSVSDIAGKLGITKGALYKHFKNKRDIFDCIVEKMYKIDAERAEMYNVPENDYNTDPEAYKTTTIKSIKKFTIAQFIFWTEDKFASAFRKMLVLEQYRNAEIAELYMNCIVSGPVEYMKNIFCELMKNGVLQGGDYNKLAVDYYAPVYLFINMYDNLNGKYDFAAMLNNHINNFFDKAGESDNGIY